MMDKKSIIIITIIVTSFVLLFALQIKFQSDITNDKQAVDLVQLEQDYRTAVQALLPEYRIVVENSNINGSAELKQRFLDLTLPASLRDSHIALVLLLEQIEAGLSVEDGQIKLNEIIAEYDWLN